MLPEYVCVAPKLPNALPFISSTLPVSGLYSFCVFLKNQFIPYCTLGVTLMYLNAVKFGRPIWKLWFMPFWNLSQKPGLLNSDALKLILFWKLVLYPSENFS